MNMKDENLMWFALTMIGIGMVFGMVIGNILANNNINEYKKEAIERGFAEHNRQDGKWQWKEGN